MEEAVTLLIFMSILSLCSAGSLESPRLGLATLPSNIVFTQPVDFIMIINVPVSFQVNFPVPTRFRRESVNDDFDYSLAGSKGHRLAILDSLLLSLHVMDPVCQRLLICMCAQEPARFQPVSDWLMQQVHNSYEDFTVSTVSSPPLRRFNDFVKAANVGHEIFYDFRHKGNVTCSTAYPSCSVDLYSIFQIPVIKALQLISPYVHFRLT